MAQVAATATSAAASASASVAAPGVPAAAPSTPTPSLSSGTFRRWQATSYGGSAGLALVDVPTVAPGRGEVCIRVLAADSTYTDLLVLQGMYRPKAPLPVTPGYCAIGVVKSIGEAVSRVRVGQRVAVMPTRGCASEEIILPEGEVHVVRDDVQPTQAVALVLTGITALQMLTRFSNGRFGPQAWLLVHGCVGGTGAMVVEIAKLLGVPADHILGTCSARNVPVAKEKLGITAFDYAPGDWPERVRAATGGRGVDLVFDHITVDGHLAKSLSATVKGGKVVCYGATNTSAPGTMAISSMIGAFARIGMQSLASSVFGSSAAEFYIITDHAKKHPEHFTEDLGKLMGWLADGSLRPFVGREWPFEGVKEALASIEANTHSGKQIIKVASAAVPDAPAGAAAATRA